MLQRLTNLLFGSLSETTQEATVPKPMSPEVDEEGWLLVNAPGSDTGVVGKQRTSSDGEASSESSEVHSIPSLSKLIGSPSSTEKCAASLINDASIVKPEFPVARSSGRASQRLVSQAGALVKVTQVGRVQRAQAQANHHNLGSNCILRQNHVRQRLPQHYSRIHHMILHQPGHRNLCH
ncbi:tumor protein p53-inducible nuclear protein 2 isoform X1 [Myxocyprinus asiaticus]|uniref:tumor protein p53-inducible nuclear protein 2 isoform X1 n=1 Tax=Myxocyprinus asiaticus TaxID=70543 RepID=UPI0022232382|nr:tumor protein p53-inducible nuclear protein 2 isoform X1 [Myxocyprinus asiaticus]